MILLRLWWRNHSSTEQRLLAAPIHRKPWTAKRWNYTERRHLAISYSLIFLATSYFPAFIKKSEVLPPVDEKTRDEVLLDCDWAHASYAVLHPPYFDNSCPISWFTNDSGTSDWQLKERHRRDMGRLPCFPSPPLHSHSGEWVTWGRTRGAKRVRQSCRKSVKTAKGHVAERPMFLRRLRLHLSSANRSSLLPPADNNLLHLMESGPGHLWPQRAWS